MCVEPCYRDSRAAGAELVPAPQVRFRRAAADLDLDLPRSFVVGDRWLDVAASGAIGARSVLVRTGYGRAAEAAPAPGVTADRLADNLMEAVSWILTHL